MSKRFEFEQTSIPSQYSINLKDNYAYHWVDARTADIYRVLFTAIARTIKIKQSTSIKRIGFSVKDDKGNFKLGAILNYRASDSESDEDTGNWYLELTFYESDMTDLDVSIDNYSDEYLSNCIRAMDEICYGRFKSSEYSYILMNEAIDTLTQFLDANAGEEEVEVVLRGIFTASVVIENGEKIMSIVPGEIIKQAVKNDAAI